MYPSPLGTSFLVSQQVLGTGQFDGSEYGRARVTLANDALTDVVTVAARRYGSAANSYTIQLIDQGAGQVVSTTQVQQVGSAVRVYLRRAALGDPLATAAEVAAAINDFHRWSGQPLCARYEGTGADLCDAVAATPLTGGADPAVNDGVSFRWAPASDPDLGFFYFEQEVPMVVTQFEAAFTIAGGPNVLTISRVPLDSVLDPIQTEAIPLFVHSSLAAATPDVALSDIRFVLPPRWALLVETDAALPGVVRMDVRREI